MPCTVVNSQSQLQARLPPLPAILPTTQGQWTAFLNTLNQWAQALQQEQHPPNVIPSQFQTFTTAAASSTVAALTASNCTPSVDATQQYYGAASLKVTISASGATLAFSGYPISIAAATRWFASWQLYAPSGCTGSLTIKTAGGHSITESFTVSALASWQQVWGLSDLRQYADTTATWQFTFTSTATVWIDGMQMNAIGDPISFLPRFAGTQMVLATGAYAANLDGIPDGITYERMPGSNMDGNRRGLIDFSQGGHLYYNQPLTVAGNCVAGLRAVQKVGGVAGWDSNAYTAKGYQNGCFITASNPVANKSVDFGLSLNPAASPSWNNIDFGWDVSSNGNAYVIYPKAIEVSLGAYAANDKFEVRYDGVTVKWYWNGALKNAVRAPGLLLHPTIALYGVGDIATDLDYGPIGDATYSTGNLLPNYSWVVGGAGTQGNFAAVGSSNSIILGDGSSATAPLGPYGTSELLWQCLGQSAVGASGGFKNYSGDVQGLDPTKSYRFSVWFRWHGPTAGTPYVYVAPQQNPAITEALNGTGDADPYFVYVPLSLLTADKWYLVTGILHGQGFAGGQSGQSGGWDPGTGQRSYAFTGLSGGTGVTYGSDFKEAAGQTVNGMLAMLYMNVTGGSNATYAWFARPRADEINGSEPSITSMLAYSLDGMPDGTTYLRMPGANMDGNRRGLIDFSQGGHISKNLDNISDGSTYGRPLASRLSSGKPWIDFSESIHANKILDNIADGTTYARYKSAGLTSGLADPSLGGIQAKGSIPPIVIGASISWTTTSGALALSWSAFTIYRPDGTTTSISTGSQNITGLTNGTTYTIYPYIVDGQTTVSFATGKTGGVGTPAICYAGGSGPAAAACYANANIPLQSFVAAPSAGGGGGGGNATGCLHPDTLVRLADGRTVPAEELGLDELVGPAGAARITHLSRQDCGEWVRVRFTHGTHATVTTDHRFLRPDGEQVRAADLHVGGIIAGHGRNVEVEALELIREKAAMVMVNVEYPHLYYLAGALSHNGNPKP